MIQNDKISKINKITGRIKPFHKKVKMPHADSGTKNINTP